MFGPEIVLANVDISPVAIIVGVCGTFAGALVGFGKRNTALTGLQNEALQAAQVQIGALQVSDQLKAERIRGQDAQIVALTSRVENAERMATSKDLIIDIAAFQGVPAEVLDKYRRPA